MNRAQYAAEAIYRALARRGNTVTIRAVTVLPGSIPQPNPPRFLGVTLAAAVNPGDITVQLAGQISGRFIAGDGLAIGNETVWVTADAIAGSPIPVIPFGSAHDAGEAVSAQWAADRVIPAKVVANTQSVSDGQLIQTRGYSVMISSWNLGAVPTERDMVVINGEQRRIVAVTPMLEQDCPISYQLMVR